jgi:hypothetical protein
VIELEDTYVQLSHPWTHEQLAACFRDSRRRGPQTAADAETKIAQPIPLLATAVPPAATATVAIHMAHALPGEMQGDLLAQLLDTAERNTADALNRCHCALELDGNAHGYTAADWHPVIYDIAAPLLASLRLHDDPPAVVRHAQDAISWLSRTIVNLHEDSPEAPAAFAETLARLVALWTFTDAALQRGSA